MSDATLDVLVIDDEPALREVLALRLADWGHTVRTAGDATDADARLRERRPDLVLSDVVLPGISGIDLLRVLKANDAELPVILMTAHGHVDAAVDAMKAGAMDFLTKPIDYDALRSLVDAVGTELGQRALDQRLDAVLGEGAVGTMVGESRSIRDVRKHLAQVATSDASVFIVGESGTGKEVAARLIHEGSARVTRPFIALNAAAIPDGLVEAELFGHEVGAFTGAVRARPGCFEQADGGTLFLDELAEMPIGLQPKLLRVLEDGRVRRLGGAREVGFDVRVIAATNREVKAAVESGRLRTDLLYRLNVFEILLPPLRDRLEDLPLLARHFLRNANARHDTAAEGIRPATFELLAAWHWPGNVRELRNVIERAVVLARGGWVEPSHLPPYLRLPDASRDRPIEVPADTTLADAERLLVLATLERTHQNKAEAARRLGLDVKTIRNKLRAWGLS